MTKIIMSDTNTLRENSTQNTFLSIMFAIAYSIGPVIPLRVLELIPGPRWGAHICLMEMVFCHKPACLRNCPYHLLHPLAQSRSDIDLRYSRNAPAYLLQAQGNRLHWPRILLGDMYLYHPGACLGRKPIPLLSLPYLLSESSFSLPFF
jgi:hypothetical protein